MNWTGAPSMVEPLAIRAMQRHGVTRYTRVRKSAVCGCWGCREVHWAWLGRHDNQSAFYPHGTGVTVACVVDAMPGETTQSVRSYLERQWALALAVLP